MPTAPEDYKPRERHLLRAERVQAEHDAGLHEYTGPQGCCDCRSAVERAGHRLIESTPPSCACGRWNPTPKPYDRAWEDRRSVEETWWQHATTDTAVRLDADPWPHMEPEERDQALPNGGRRVRA